MKRWAWVGLIGVALAAAPAGAVNLGLGVAGGASFALAQSDNGNGGQLGLRLPINVVPLLTIEPFLTSTDCGGVEASFSGKTYDRRGFDITSYGAVVALGGVGMGARFPLYPFLGVGSYHLGREGTPRQDEIGYLAGIGYAHALPVNFALNVRADFNWISSGESARRFFEVSLGVTVRFHPGSEEGF